MEATKYLKQATDNDNKLYQCNQSLKINSNNPLAHNQLLKIYILQAKNKPIYNAQVFLDLNRAKNGC